MGSFISCRKVVYGSPDYHSALDIRTEVLRKPLGLVFDPEELKKEVNFHHFVAYQAGEVVGTLMLVELSESALKMRQVAVLNEAQGQGVGQALVEAAEKFAVQNSFKRIELHARDTAVPFYLKLGYLAIGEEFLEVGIPHRAMSRTLR